MKQVYDAVPREDGGWKIVVKTLQQEPEQSGKYVVPIQSDKTKVHIPHLIQPSKNQATQSPSSSEG